MKNPFRKQESDEPEKPKVSRKEKCCDCKFWERHSYPPIKLGSCHFGPPTGVANGGVAFPVTNETDWCGKWES